LARKSDPAGFSAQSINNVPAHSLSSDSVTVSVSPFRHPLTKPGLYPVLITADSHEGRARGLDAIDPSGERRTNANDVIFVKVESFFDPQLSVDLPANSAKPGVTLTYSVEGVNGGNVDDTEALSNRFVDFNSALCTLTTLGGSATGCPFRAVPTQIPASLWTTISTLDPQFGPLTPLGSGHDTFNIGAPLEWAGMQDTTYEVIITERVALILPTACSERKVAEAYGDRNQGEHDALHPVGDRPVHRRDPERQRGRRQDCWTPADQRSSDNHDE